MKYKYFDKAILCIMSRSVRSTPLHQMASLITKVSRPSTGWTKYHLMEHEIHSGDKIKLGKPVFDLI